jgi:putative hydrolase of the HAD superfamily
LKHGPTPMVKAVFLDLDDTLIDTQVLYDRARAELGTFLSDKFGVDAQGAIQVTKRRSHELLDRLGYSKERFPRCLEDTVRFFRPGASAEDLACARELGEAVFWKTATLKEGAEDAVRILGKEFKLFLVTKGDPEVQQRRINELPFKQMFAVITIWRDKSAAALRELAADAGLLPIEVVFIGDSLWSDINPAVEAGMGAILLASNNWQLHEMEGHSLPLGVIQVRNLMEGALALVGDKLRQVMSLAWSASTSADSRKCSSSNPSRGQCAVTSCLVQDRVGGEIVRVQYRTPEGEKGSHYFNVLPDGQRIDLTHCQFAGGTTFTPSLTASIEELLRVTRDYVKRKGAKGSPRDYVLSFKATEDRYKLLLANVQAAEEAVGTTR